MHARMSALLTWAGERYLKVSTLDRPVRRLTVVGLMVTGVAAVAMVVASLNSSTMTTASCLQSPAALTATIVISVVALVALAVGLVMLGLAGRAGRWRYPRVRSWLLVSTPLLLVATQLIGFELVYAGRWELLGLHARALPLFLGAAAPLLVMVLTRGHGPRNPTAFALTILTGFVSVGLCTSVYAVLAGPCLAASFLHGTLAVLGFVFTAGGIALLIWLASEGLRLSGEIGVWAMARVTAGRLLVALLAAKAVAALVVVVVLGSDGIQSVLGVRPSSLLFAVPLVVVVALLLVWENRLVAITLAGYTVVSRAFLLLIAAVLSPIALLGLLALFSALPQWPALALALAVTVAGVVLTGLLLRRGAPATRLAAIGAAVTLPVLAVISYLLLVWAFRHPRPIDFDRATAAFMDPLHLGLLLAAPAALGLVVVAALLRRRQNRRYVAFFVAFGLWLIATQVMPQVTAGRWATSALAVDVVLTVAIAGLGLAYALGGQRSVSLPELVLLLITSSVIVEVPALAGTVPTRWSTPLLILAFLTPALTALTLSAGPPNEPGPDRSSKVLATVGTLCLSYGALTALAVVLVSPLTTLQTVAGYVNGLIALPFAVVLVAVTSATHYGADASGNGALSRP